MIQSQVNLQQPTFEPQSQFDCVKAG